MVKGTRVEDISPANEAEGQNTSAGRTKLLGNERDSETYIKRSEMLVVSGTNQGFFSHLGC